MAEKPQRDKAYLATRCKAAWKRHAGEIRRVAWDCGYAIGLHGTVARDIDLMCMPWIEAATSPLFLVEQITDAIPGADLKCFMMDGKLIPWLTKKPHGRLAYTIHLHGDGKWRGLWNYTPYLDLSIMPRLP